MSIEAQREIMVVMPLPRLKQLGGGIWWSEACVEAPRVEIEMN